MRKGMASRRRDPLQFGKSPSINSCFPETKSIEGSDYKSEYRTSRRVKAQSFDIDDRFNAAISIKNISYDDIFPLSSINVEPSSSLVYYDNALYHSLPQKLETSNSRIPLSAIQNFNFHSDFTGQNLPIVPESKENTLIDILPNQCLKPAGPSNSLKKQVSFSCSEQPMLAPSEFAVSTQARETNLGEMKNHTRHIPLYLAALKGDWKTAEVYLRRYPHAVRATITVGLETALHIAAGARHTQFVKKIVRRMTADDLALRNKVGNTALCFAAASGITEIAKVLVNNNRNLPLVRGSQGATPLYMAVLLGKRDMAWYLYSVTDDKDLSGEDRIGLLVAAITTNLFDVALVLIRSHPELAIVRDGNEETALHVLSRKPKAFYSGHHLGFWQRCIYACLQVELRCDFPSSATDDDSVTQLIKQVLPTSKTLLWKGLLYFVPDIKLLYNIKLRHLQALELVKLLWQEILLLDDTGVKNLIRTPKRLLFTAAELGVVEFITVLINSYPDLIWKVDEKCQSIFHIAVANRQEKVFNLIYEIGALRDFIAIYKDEENNNMLHLVGKLPNMSQLNTDSGAALQLRRELIWFKAVEKIVQPLYAEMENSEGKTPQSLFSIEHKKLVHEGEKWMKDTASSCMVVATLIATVMFAATFTVPGGNNGDTGMPTFLRKRSFMIFLVSDAIALFSSATSILIFLSILTTRYAEEDFLQSLPNKLIMGLATLFISISAMMVAFSATLFIVLGYRLDWGTFPIAMVACIPVLMFASLQFPLVVDIVGHRYRSSIFYSSRNQLLS